MHMENAVDQGTLISVFTVNGALHVDALVQGRQRGDFAVLRSASSLTTYRMR